MSKTSAHLIAAQELAAFPPPDDLSYELDVALMALRLIEAGGDAQAIARGALGLIAPEGYPQHHDEAADLAVRLFGPKAAPAPVDGDEEHVV